MKKILLAFLLATVIVYFIPSGQVMQTSYQPNNYLKSSHQLLIPVNTQASIRSFARPYHSILSSTQGTANKISGKYLSITKQTATYSPNQEPLLTPQITLVNSFGGIQEKYGLYDNGYPSDVNLAAGSNYIVEAVNTEIGVFDKLGNLIKPQILNDLFNFPINDNVGDPRVLYDWQSQRWFISAIDFNTGIVKLAVSKTSDPTGAWWIYTLNQEQGYCPDFDSIGFSSDKVALTANVYPNCTSSYISDHVRIWIFDKYQLISNSSPLALYTVNYNCMINNYYICTYFNFKPVVSLTNTTTLYMASDDWGSYNNYNPPIMIFAVTGNPTQNNVVINETDLSISPIYQPFGAPQPNTNATINPNDARISSNPVWKQNMLWFATETSCIPQGDSYNRDCIRVFSINTKNYTLIANTTISQVGKYLFYPALSLDQNNNVIIVYGYSSPSDYPSINVTTLLNNNLSHWLSPVTLKTGASVETRGRYGDYFGAATDPQDPTKVWVAGQYMPSYNDWGTYIGEVSITTPTTQKVTMTLSYSVIGNAGYSPPVFSYILNGQKQTATLSTTPTQYSVDMNTRWNITSILAGSTQSMRWATGNQTSGIASSNAVLNFLYFQQYSIAFTYKISDNSNTIPPSINYTKFSKEFSVIMPTYDWADAGTAWSVQKLLKNSSTSERWITENTTNGNIQGPISVTIIYYHQFFINFSFKVIGIGSYITPNVTYYSFGLKKVDKAPLSDWVDSKSVWSMDNPLINSNATERWMSGNATTATIMSSKNINIVYYLQVLINLDFKIIGGGNPDNPWLAYYQFGSLQNNTLTPNIWIDINSTLEIQSILNPSNNNERWITFQTNYLIEKPESLDLIYYRQFYVSLSYQLVNGENSISPSVSYFYGGNETQNTLPFNGWVDSMSLLNVTNPIMISSNERLYSTNSTNITVNGSISSKLIYWIQFLVNLNLNIAGGGQISPWVNYFSTGQLFNKTLPLSAWIDANSTISYQSIISFNIQNERWITNGPLQIELTSPLNTTITYYHQYFIELMISPPQGGSLNFNSGWYNATSVLKIVPTENTGWKFEKWIGNGTGSYSGVEKELDLEVKGSVVETAVFYVDVSIHNSNGVTIQYSYNNTSGSISPGESIDIFVPQNTTITLTANPSSFLYTFSGWSGSVNSNSNVVQVKASGPLTLQTKYDYNYTNILIIAIITLALAVTIIILIRSKIIKK
ncbi:MAG TPA: hypothetical protein VKU94_07115 [Geobacterales bacterium]|nr:hypothetical protein [Geobacterales bacterium]